MKVANLRSPRERVGGIVYFGRMLDKARLHARGDLPEEFQANLGTAFDDRCVKFLQVQYRPLIDYALAGHTDDEALAWAFEHGRKPSEEEIEVWNGFMEKRAWNDEATPILLRRLKEGGWEDRTDIQTMFDYIDLDEGRDPALPKKT